MAMSERPPAHVAADEEVRRRAVQQQVGVPLDRCRDLLLTALGDDSWRVRKEAVEVLVTARPGRSEIDGLIELLRHEDNAGLRNAAAELLVRLGTRAVPALLDHLNDHDHDLRKLVVDTLAAIGERSAVPALLTALGDPDVNVAAAAAEALGAIGDRSSAPALLLALDRQQHDFFRFNALAALGRIAAPGPLPPVVARLARHDMLRLAAYECLGTIGADTAAADLLLDGVQSGLPSLRSVALRSLAAVLHNLEPLFRQAVVDRLKGLFDQGLLETLNQAVADGNPDLTEAVVSLLGELADPRGIPLLLQSMAEERLAGRAMDVLQSIGIAAIAPSVARFALADEAERAAICTLLGRLGQLQPEVEQTISRALSDGAALVRRAAAVAVAAVPSVPLLSAVTGLLEDDDPAVRDAALQTLRARGDSHRELVREIAGQMISSELPEQRRAAALLCAASGDCEQLALLIKDEHAAVREAGVRAVGRLRLAASCPSLVMALVDEAEEVRIAAAESLGDCCSQSQVSSSLRLALQDPSSWVQAAALRSLVELSGEGALPDALELWQRGDEVAQLACLEVFDLLAAPEGYALISQALGQQDGEVLKGIIEVLTRHAPDLLLPWLHHILSHTDWDVRMSAVRACANLPPDERHDLLRMALDREDHDLVRQALWQLLNGN
jgi:HEAT repeat protein